MVGTNMSLSFVESEQDVIVRLFNAQIQEFQPGLLYFLQTETGCLF